MVYNVLHSVSFPPQLPDFHDFQKKNGGPPARRVRWVLSGFSNQKNWRETGFAWAETCEGPQLQWRPVPGRGQHVTRVTGRPPQQRGRKMVVMVQAVGACWVCLCRVHSAQTGC